MNLTADQRKWMEELTSQMSNNYEGGPIYIGDPFTDFGGATSFLDEELSGLQFQMSITNDSSADRTVAILPAYKTNASEIADQSGSAVDGIVTDGTINSLTGLSGSGDPKNIEDFKRFVKNNPCRIVHIKVKVDNTTQLTEPLYIKKESPFRNLDDWRIPPASYQTAKDNNDKVVDIPVAEKDLQADDQTVITVKVKASRTLTLTFFIGAINNSALALSNKYKLAKQSFSRAMSMQNQ